MTRTRLAVVITVVAALGVGGWIATSTTAAQSPRAQPVAELSKAGQQATVKAQTTRASGDSRISIPFGTDAEAPSAALRLCTTRQSAGSGDGAMISCASFDELPNGTTVTMLCWQDGEIPQKEDGTGFTAPGWDSPRWFLVRTKNGRHPGWVGFVYSGTIPISEQIITPRCGDDTWRQVGAPEWQRELEFVVTGTCTTDSGTLGARSANFTPGEPYVLTVAGPSGAVVPITTSAKVTKDGTVPFTWDCRGDAPGIYTAAVQDKASGREVTNAHFVVGNAISGPPTSNTTSAPPPSPPPSSDVFVTVLNQTTNGATQMRRELTPTYLSSKMLPRCKAEGCAVAGADMVEGDRLQVTCQTTGARLTNGNDADPRDDGNPGLATSDVWYRGRWTGGQEGYVSVVWLVPGDRTGRELPRC